MTRLRVRLNRDEEHAIAHKIAQGYLDNLYYIRDNLRKSYPDCMAGKLSEDLRNRAHTIIVNKIPDYWLDRFVPGMLDITPPCERRIVAEALSLTLSYMKMDIRKGLTTAEELQNLIAH